MLLLLRGGDMHCSLPLAGTAVDCDSHRGFYCIYGHTKYWKFELLAFDELSTFDTSTSKCSIKRPSPYNVFESKSIKSGFFIESCKFQRPRGRYFFWYMCKFRPAFSIQFKNILHSFARKFNRKIHVILISYVTFKTSFSIWVKFCYTGLVKTWK